MKETEIVKQLETAELPEIKLESHRGKLRAELLAVYSKREVSFMESARTQVSGIFKGLFAPRPAWQVAATTALAMLVLFTTLVSIPPTSAIIKSALFPEGSRSISGPQLPAADEQKARDILAADSRIKDIIAQGAVIDKILPIEVTLIGETGEIKETWAQAWLVKGSRDWGVQIDLIRGQIVSISP